MVTAHVEIRRPNGGKVILDSRNRPQPKSQGGGAGGEEGQQQPLPWAGSSLVFLRDTSLMGFFLRGIGCISVCQTPTRMPGPVWSRQSRLRD